MESMTSNNALKTLGFLESSDIYVLRAEKR